MLGEGTPADDAQRAAGLRYLTRFLAAGLRLCIETDDADDPVFARMIDNAMSWGLDNPDYNYSWARLRGDASYRIEGTRGSARQLEFQVNTGHVGDGKMPAFSGGEGGWRTVSHLTGDHLESDRAQRSVRAPHQGAAAALCVLAPGFSGGVIRRRARKRARSASASRHAQLARPSGVPGLLDGIA